VNTFSTESNLYKIMTLVGELIVLNLLFVLCCLPVFTIGASVTSLYSVLLKLVNKKESYIRRDFLKAFKENFKQSTLGWLIFLLIGIVFYMDLRISNHLDSSLGFILRTVFWIFIAMLGFLVSFFFPLQAKFKNTLKNTAKNAFWMSFGYLPLTISILVIEIFPIFLMYWKPEWEWKVIPFMLCIGFALQGLGCTCVFNQIFKKYIPEEEN